MDAPERHAAITVAYTNNSDLIKPRLYSIPLSAVIRNVKDEIIENYPGEAGPVPQHSRLVLIYKGQILEDSKLLSDVLKVTASCEEAITQATFHLVVKPLPASATTPVARIPAPAIENEQARREPNNGGNPTPAQQIEQQIVDRAVNHLQQTTAIAAAAPANQPAPTRTTAPAVVVPIAANSASQQVHRITAPSDPLHVLKLSVPCPGGPKTVSIPCYDYMFAPTADGQLVFCMSPTALMQICNTGAELRVLPRLYRQVASTPAAAPGAANMSLRRYVENAFTNAVRQLAWLRDGIFLIFRLLFMFNILSFQIRDRVQFWLICIPVALILIYQSEVFHGLLRPVFELIPGFPRANDDNNNNGADQNAGQVANGAPAQHNERQQEAQAQEQNPNWATARRAAVMFVTSLVPPLHDRWAVERARADEAAAAQIQPGDANEVAVNAEQNAEDIISGTRGATSEDDLFEEYGASTQEIGEVQKSTDYADHTPILDSTSDMSPGTAIEPPTDRATSPDEQL